MIKKIQRILTHSISAILAVFRLDREVKESVLVAPDTRIEEFRQWGFYSEKFGSEPRVLMAAGHGYGNVGDEAQCGACIGRWRQVAPDCRITLFSPNPAYTEALHGERAVWAPRVAWFRANTDGPYFNEGRSFYPFFYLLRVRLSLSCRLMRARIPLSLLLPREAQVLQLLQEHDLLHISGGGFLTGKTRSRLWENCLLMRMCQLLNKPYMLTGHNIGVFQDEADRKVARMGLRGARLIGLRDRGISERELAEIGISGEHVRSTCDDALLCDRLDANGVKAYLADAGLDSEKQWVAVQFHYWGQAEEGREKIAKRYAEICDKIVTEHGFQVVLIAMTPSDVEPEERIASLMQESTVLAPYSPDYKVVRGIIADAEFVFTMKHHPIVFAQGEGVPIISVSLDDYYYLKNKGALDNTGHGDFLVNGEDFYTDLPEKLICRVLNDRSKIQGDMLTWVEAMKQIELRDYQAMAADRTSASI
jgi:polysaccharide pyruvyl transferase WcaK-like protein